LTKEPNKASKAPDEEKSQAQKDIEKEVDSHAAAAACSELLFVILPFIVIAITLAHRCELRTIFFIPEWSIVSAVITGQSIVKLASITVGRSVAKDPIVLILSILLVCLLVPILTILAIVLTSSQVSLSLAIVQGVLFTLSAVVFGGVSALQNWAR
jgi:hypothetical protein